MQSHTLTFQCAVLTSNVYPLLGVKWGELGQAKAGKYVDVQPSIDLSESFADADLEPWDSAVFAQY
jgi:hypothetical protein